MKCFFIVLLSIVSMSNLFGQATANSDGNWSNTGTWQSGNIGDGGEDVTMLANVDIVIQNGESFTIGAINIGKSGSITVNSGGTLIIDGLFTADKEFTINVDGTMTINGNMVVAKDLNLNVTGTMDITGNVDLAKDASLSVDGSLDVTGSFTSDKDAVVTVNGDMDVGGDLNLGTGSIILGTGPVTADNCTGSACGDSQLPVELVDFMVSINNHFVDISWSTLTEENNDYFTIERSKDGVVFEEIATVKGAGNSVQRLNYSLSDNTPFKGVSYYRLKQTDFDGDSETFDLKAVQYTTIDRLNIYPNPAKRGGDLRIVTGAMDEEVLQIDLIDQAGHLISSTNENGGYTNVSINPEINPGIYFLKITSGSISKISRIIVQ